MEGALKILKIFSDHPAVSEKNFCDSPEVLQNLSKFITKTAGLASVFFDAEIAHPLGLLKVKAGNLKGILMVVRVYRINNLYAANKKFSRLVPIVPHC